MEVRWIRGDPAQKENDRLDNNSMVSKNSSSGPNVNKILGKKNNCMVVEPHQRSVSINLDDKSKRKKLDDNVMSNSKKQRSGKEEVAEYHVLAPPGTMVKVDNLKNHTAINGTFVKIVDFIAEEGRYKVMFPDHTLGKIKPLNCFLIEQVQVERMLVVVDTCSLVEDTSFQSLMTKNFNSTNLVMVLCPQVVYELDGLKNKRTGPTPSSSFTEVAINARKAIQFIRSLQLNNPHLIQSVTDDELTPTFHKISPRVNERQMKADILVLACAVHCHQPPLSNQRVYLGTNDINLQVLAGVHNIDSGSMNELSSILKTREDEFSKKPTHIATSSLAERARQVAKLTAKYQSKFIDVCDDMGRTPLIRATHANDVEETRRLIHAGADINKRSKKRLTTPLYIASYKNHVEIVELLVEAHADVNIVNNKGHTPLSQAKGSEVEKLLLAAGAK